MRHNLVCPPCQRMFSLVLRLRTQYCCPLGTARYREYSMVSSHLPAMECWLFAAAVPISRSFARRRLRSGRTAPMTASLNRTWLVLVTAGTLDRLTQQENLPAFMSPAICKKSCYASIDPHHTTTIALEGAVIVVPVDVPPHHFVCCLFRHSNLHQYRTIADKYQMLKRNHGCLEAEVTRAAINELCILVASPHKIMVLRCNCARDRRGFPDRAECSMVRVAQHQSHSQLIFDWGVNSSLLPCFAPGLLGGKSRNEAVKLPFPWWITALGLYRTSMRILRGVLHELEAIC